MASALLPANTVSSLDLVLDAIGNKRPFKFVGHHLECRRPDLAALHATVSAFHRGDAHDWLTAFLLGCIGHEDGYRLVREILLGSGASAVSYAGIALMRINPAQAFDELSYLLFHGKKLQTRESAAYGLDSLNCQAVSSLIFQAGIAGRVRRSTAAVFAVRVITLGQLLELLRSPKPYSVRFGITVAINLSGPDKATLHALLRTIQDRRDFADEIRRVLKSPATRLSPKDRAILATRMARYPD